MPNQTTLNWTMHSQTKACITKSSCQTSAFLKYYAVQSGNSFPTFWNNLSVSSSKVKKSKKENTIQLKITASILFPGTSSIVKVQAKKYLTWWTVWIELFSPKKHYTCLRYVPKNRSSPRTVTGKQQLKNYKLPTRLKNKTWTKPQIKNH